MPEKNLRWRQLSKVQSQNEDLDMVRKSGTFVPKLFQNPQTEPIFFVLKIRISDDIQCGDFLQENYGLPPLCSTPLEKIPKG